MGKSFRNLMKSHKKPDDMEMCIRKLDSVASALEELSGKDPSSLALPPAAQFAIGVLGARFTHRFGDPEESTGARQNAARDVQQGTFTVRVPRFGFEQNGNTLNVVEEEGFIVVDPTASTNMDFVNRIFDHLGLFFQEKIWETPDLLEFFKSSVVKKTELKVHLFINLILFFLLV